MPRRHGIRRDGLRPVGLFGVWDFFEILARPPFRTSSLGTRDEPTILAFHFRHTLQLLFYHLDSFQQKYIAFDRFLEEDGLAGPNPGLFWEIQTEANAAAQGILTTLNILLDDIARIIPFVLFSPPNEKQKPKQGFVQLKKHVLNKYPETKIVTSLKTLFAQLDDTCSWFITSLEYGIGMHQRLRHYTDLIILSASAPPGEAKMQPRFELASIGMPKPTFDFPAEIKNVLHGLCDWLDDLDAILTQQMSDRARAEGFNWAPNKECPGYSLPIVGSSTDRILPEIDYLYLPLCPPSV